MYTYKSQHELTKRVKHDHTQQMKEKSLIKLSAHL